MALEATESDRAQADGKHQGHGAADGQGDPSGGLPRPARRGGGDDTEEAGREAGRHERCGVRRRSAWGSDFGEGIIGLFCLAYATIWRGITTSIQPVQLALVAVVCF